MRSDGQGLIEKGASTNRVMKDDRTTLLASAIVIAAGALWGVYWLPVRSLAEAGLPGAWGTLLAAAVAALLTAPAAIIRRQALRQTPPSVLLFYAIGGFAFVLYSVALVYGRVAIIIVLFYLTPVWSTLIGRYVMGWPITPLRLGALATGLAGLAIMLGTGGNGPLPRNLGEWLALLSGILWAVSATGIRTRSNLAATEAGFVFVAGACVGALLLVPILALPAPEVAIGPALAWSVAAGSLWWAIMMTALMWATARLDPTRVGILLMSEVLVGAASGAIFLGEHLGPMELLGGALVLAAGVMEVWPTSRR